MSESEIFSQLRRGINDLEGVVHESDLNNGVPAGQGDSTTDSVVLTANGKSNGIDFQSEDLFPALPASATPKPAQAWRPAMAMKSEAASAAADTGRKSAGGKKVTDKFEIPISMQQKLPLNGKGSALDLAKILGLRTQTTIEVLANRTTFVITGKPDSVKSARRELTRHIGATITEVIYVPSSVRPHILGAGGKNLKDLTARTGTSIQVPKANPAQDADAADADEEQPITIKGNFAGVGEAKKEIEELVLKRTQNLNSRIVVDRSYHPFIAGANNATVESIEAATGARIHIPPLVPADKKEGAPEKNPNEISVVGSREAIKAAEMQIRVLYDNLERNTRTLSFPVKKRQHRFIIGSKGKNLTEILEQTGCSVELPLASDPSDMVTVRGPDNMLSVALQAVLQRANQVSLEEIHVVNFIPKATSPALFNRYLFTKERDEVKKIETNHNVSINRLSGPDANPEDPIIEIQGKSKSEAEAARIEMAQLIREWGAVLFFGDVEIPHGLHKFVVGKGGQNITKMKAQPIWEGRLVDVVVPNESDASDEVLLVVKRLSRGLAGAPNAKAAKKPVSAPPANDDAEVLAFVDRVRAEILSVSLASADFVTEILPVPGKFHGRLIGSGGKDLKELLSTYGDEVSIRFPPAKDDKKKEDGPRKSQAVDADTVVIKGPKKLVADAKAKVVKVVAELKRIETLASHSDTLKVKKGTGKKLVQGAGAPISSGSNVVHDRGLGGDSIYWLIRLVKDALAASPPTAKAGEDVITAEDNHLINLLKVEVTESTSASGDDVITFTGPKAVVAIARKIVSDRSVRLANQVTLELKVFHICSNEAKAVLKENAIPDLKNKVLRRLIGKEGKFVKALMDKYAVDIRFPEGGKKRQAAGDDEAEVEEESDEGAIVDGLVIIKGNPKDTEAAKVEIMKSVENDIVRSFATSFVIPRSALPHVLGSQGSKIKALRERYDVRVELRDVEDSEGEVSIEISLEGSKANCLAVQKTILGVTDEVVNVETRTIAVPSYLHKDIIGPGGSRIKVVIDAFGGSDKVKVQFPPRGDSAIGSAESNVVSIKGHASQIDALTEAVTKVVDEVLAGDSADDNVLRLYDESADATISASVTVPRADVSRVLGKGGESVKVVMRRFKVLFWFSETSSESETVEVKIVGLSGNEDGLKKAAEDIKGKIRMSKKVNLPPKVKANLATAGEVHDSEAASIQELMKKVRADSAGAAFAEISGASLAGSDDAFILVRGDTKYVELSVKSLEKGLLELTKYDVTSRIQVDGSLRPHIIGKGGATIIKIRTETGAFVELSKPGNTRNASVDVVVIRGTADAVALATEAIQKIIQDQSSRIAADAARVKANAEKDAASFSAGPARIDDDAQESYEPSFIPGFAPSQKGQKGKKPAVPLTAAPSSATAQSSAPVVFGSLNSVGVSESWQDVKKKGKKGEEELSTSTLSTDSPATIPGGGPSKKKKKNKKKAESGTDAVIIGDEADEDVVESVLVVPARAPSPAPQVKAVKNVAVDIFKPMVSSAPTPTPSPAMPVSAKQLPTVAAPAPKSRLPVSSTIEVEGEDDGWTVINKKGVSTVAATAAEGGETAAAKKKKNKKKKKKAAGDAVGGQEDNDEADD